MRNLKTGSKFQLIDDLKIKGITYPNGLVFSLVHLSIISTGKIIIFKVLKAKPIVKRYYQNIPDYFYIPSSWHFWEMVSLFGEEFDVFFEGIENGSIVSFDVEYDVLTHSKSNGN